MLTGFLLLVNHCSSHFIYVCRARGRRVPLAESGRDAYVIGVLDPTRHADPRHQPIFNVPPVIVGLAVVLVAIQALRSVVGEATDIDILALFAFIPARFDPTVFADGVLPGGTGADVWTFVTYAFLHADFMHVGVNTLWLLAFGSPVARRFGMARFLAFFLFTAAAGAGLHLLTHAGEPVPMIGASAAVSGCMAAALRFMFATDGYSAWRPDAMQHAVLLPAPPLMRVLRDRRVISFVAVWFAINLAFGLGAPSGIASGAVAWEAHIGGFLAGLLAFPLFDPVRRTPADRRYAD
ncbi:rhomboid family intramembrane serine protease [Ancylobacter sonchi]|nr:rhomboid family intramembrane serine protease [Ancylobacter sonchi]